MLHQRDRELLDNQPEPKNDQILARVSIGTIVRGIKELSPIPGRLGVPRPPRGRSAR